MKRTVMIFVVCSLLMIVGTIISYALSSDTLTSLSTTNGTLSPSFDPSVLNYTVDVGTDIESIGWNVSGFDPDTHMDLSIGIAGTIKRIDLQGTRITSYSQSVNLILVGGANTFTIDVTAEDNSIKNFVITINKPEIKYLTDITVSKGTLTPDFNHEVTSYGVTVDYSAETIGLNMDPFSADNLLISGELATGVRVLKVQGQSITVGSPSWSQPLVVGDQDIEIEVTANDYTVRTYTLTVTRLDKEETLTGITLSQGSITGGFDRYTTTQVAPMDYEISSIGYNYTPASADTHLDISFTLDADVNQVFIEEQDVTSGGASWNQALATGYNLIDIRLVKTGGYEETYTLRVVRAENDATLESLTVDPGSLTPAFDASVFSYAVSVANEIDTVAYDLAGSTTASQLDIVGVLSADTQSLLIQDTAVTGVDPIWSQALVTGDNDIVMKVTSERGIEETFTITVTRATSSDNDLSGMVLSSGTLSPVFDSATTSYSLDVGYSVNSITLTPTLSDLAGSVKVNDVAVNSGEASASIDLSLGDNTLTVLVTAENGDEKTYTVTVTRDLGDDSDLTSLGTSTGTLSPVFDSNVLTYSLDVANSVENMTVTPANSNSDVTIKVNGTDVASGNTSGSIALSTGDNTITILVTAENGDEKTYTLTVTRAYSTDNDLSGLVISSGSLSPAFDSATTTYTLNVDYSITGITVTPTLSSAVATVKVNSVDVNSGDASSLISLTPGDNTVTILAAAENGDEKTYTVTVTRDLGNDSDLTSVTTSTGTLSPVFEASVLTYALEVGNLVESMTVTPTVSDVSSSVKVNGSTVASGSASQSIGLNVGENTITVLVTAENGDEKSYTITVTRLESSNNALSDLSFDVGTIMPTFDSNIFTYAVNVDNEIETIAYNDVSVTSGSAISISLEKEDSTASISFNGTEINETTSSWSESLLVGDNTITITVTAENGSERDYSILVTRDSSANNNLSDLVLSDSSLSPDFDKNITSYTISVGYRDTEIGFSINDVVSGAAITINPVMDDSTASLDINGQSLNSSDEVVVDLDKGDNPIDITVIAEDGSEKAYSLIVTRGESNNYYLSNLLIDDGNYNIEFDRDTNYYNVNVPYSRSRITITAIKANEDASITIDSVDVESGVESGNLILEVGKNTFDIEVTAGSGVTKIYRVNIIRVRASSNKNRDESSSATNDEIEEIPVIEEIDLVEINKPSSVVYEVLTVDEKKVLSATIEAKHEAGISKARIFKELMRSILNESRDRDSNQKRGNNDKDNEIELYVKDAFFDLELEMMKEAIELIITEGVTALRIQTDRGSVQFDEDAIGAISQQTESDLVTLVIEHDEFDSDDNRIDDRPVINLSLLEQEKEISEFGTGKAYVEIPYELKDGEKEEAIIVLYINEKGEIESIPSTYNADNGTVDFETNHFSNYVIGYNQIEYSDVFEEDWYYKAVQFISARGIANGTSDGRFSPTSPITRGQLLVMLMKAYEIEPDENPSDNFSDAGNTYYTGYLSKAKQLGIVSGAGQNMYHPEFEVSRQELFVVVYNTMKYLNEMPNSAFEVNVDNLNDSADIQPWAKEAIKVLVESRIISGNRLGYIDPTRTATRAEMAQLIYNLLK